MIRRAAATLLLLLASTGCRQLLDIPSDLSEVDGGAGAEDDGSDGDDGDDGDDGADGADDGADDDGGTEADAGQDAGSGGDGGGDCVGTTPYFVGFDDPNELDDWTLDFRFDCEMAVAGGRLEARQPSPPGFCRAFGDLQVNIVGIGMQVQAIDPGDDQMSLVYSIILNDGTEDISDRRRLRIERDDGEIRLGECTSDSCDTTTYGSFPFDPQAHSWWRIGHDSATNEVHFEFASDNEMFSEPAGALPVTGITPDLVQCVGAELGTYETSTAGTAAFDFLVGG